MHAFVQTPMDGLSTLNASESVFWHLKMDIGCTVRVGCSTAGAWWRQGAQFAGFKTITDLR